jgi:hypothetical protein
MDPRLLLGQFTLSGWLASQPKGGGDEISDLLPAYTPETSLPAEIDLGVDAEITISLTRDQIAIAAAAGIASR